MVRPSPLVPQPLQLNVNPRQCPPPVQWRIPKTKVSLPLTAQWTPTQLTPIHTAQACFQFKPHYQKTQPSALQPSASGDNQTPGLGHPPQGSADRPSHEQQWQLKLLSLGNNSSLPKETLEDVRDCQSSEIWLYKGELESLKEDKSNIEMICPGTAGKMRRFKGKLAGCTLSGKSTGDKECKIGSM